MKLYQLTIALEGIKPTIWRRILVSENLNFHYLHHVIQIVMGWQNYHLWEFKKGEFRIGYPELLEDSLVQDDQEVCVKHFLKKEGDEILYEYDFGDCWLHKISVEKIFETTKFKPYPVLEAGERACPPEDCGGIGGYEELVAAMKDKDHPEREEFIEWLGGPFEPEKFTGMYSINQALKGLREYANRWNRG